MVREAILETLHADLLEGHGYAPVHLFFLVAPDFLGTTSALPLLDTHPDVVDIARRLKGLGNQICDAVAGRTTHPVSILVGGMGARPDRATLLELQQLLREAMRGYIGGLGPDHPQSIMVTYRLVRSLVGNAKHAEARAIGFVR